MINEAVFVLRTGVTVPCHRVMFAMSHICLHAQNYSPLVPIRLPAHIRAQTSYWLLDYLQGQWQIRLLNPQSFLSILAIIPERGALLDVLNDLEDFQALSSGILSFRAD